MSDRPILFSAPMIHALLAGRKTQTRRTLKPQPEVFPIDSAGTLCDVGLLHVQGDRLPRITTGRVITEQEVRFAVGDRLWVKETWSHSGHGVWTIADARRQISGAPIYRATADVDPGVKWWPSIFMPREFSRLTLTVTDVRVQRLQDCSEADAKSEGVHRIGAEFGAGRLSTTFDSGPNQWTVDVDGWGISAPTAVECYGLLWDFINGAGAWDANPWVVAVSFDVRKGNIDAALSDQTGEG